MCYEDVCLCLCLCVHLNEYSMYSDCIVSLLVSMQSLHVMQFTLNTIKQNKPVKYM